MKLFRMLTVPVFIIFLLVNTPSLAEENRKKVIDASNVAEFKAYLNQYRSCPLKPHFRTELDSIEKIIPAFTRRGIEEKESPRSVMNHRGFQRVRWNERVRRYSFLRL